MSVEISDADWKVLQLTTKREDSSGNLENDIAYSIDAYRKEGKSDEEIQQILNKHIESKRPMYDDIMGRLKKLNKESDEKMAKMQEDLAHTEKVEAGLGFLSRYLNGLSFGLGDLGAAGVDWAAKQVGVDTGLIEGIKGFEEEHPGLTTTANVLSIFTPGGGISKAIQLGTKAGKLAKTAVVGEKVSKTAKAAGYLAEVGARSAIAEGAFQIQKNIERAAGVEDWKEGQDVLSTVGDWGQGTLANIGLDMVFGGMGAAYRKVKDTIVTTNATVKLLGGADNVLKGRGAFKAAKKSGLTDAEAAGAFFAKIAEGVSPEEAKEIGRMIQKSPAFRDKVMQQLSLGENFVYNTAGVLTNAEKSKAAQNINEFLGKAYTDAIGARQLGTTADDLISYMGVNSKKFQEIKSAGLKEAEESIMRDPLVFEDNVRSAGKILRQDKTATDIIINGAEVANFSALQSGGHAEKAMAEYVNKAKDQFIRAQMQQMKNVAPEEMQTVAAQLSEQFEKNMADGVRKQFAQNFTESMIKNGTDNVYDLMDLQNYVKDTMKKDVMKGASNAVGTYHKQINRLMGAESKILDGSLKAMTNSEKMLELHQLGENFTRNDITTLERILSEAGDAKEAATKLAGFKLGFENKFLEAMISGNAQEFSRLKAMTEKSGVLGKFFEPGELKRFAEMSAPKVIAANNLRNWMAATGKYEGNATLIDAVIRTFIAGAAGARVAGANAAVSTARQIHFGPKTMAMVENFATNPSAEAFNKMLSVKDATERNMMQRVVDSLADGINQYLIYTGKTLQQGD